MMTPSLREELILSHIPQVKLLPRHLHRRCPQVELDDLISAGTLGLIRAVDRFDTKRNLKLKTLAEHRIRGAMLDYLRYIDPLPRNVRRFQKQRDVVIAKLQARWRGRQPRKERSGARCFVTEVCNAFENNRGSGANLDSRVDSRPGVDRLVPVNLGQRSNPWILVPALSLALLACSQGATTVGSSARNADGAIYCTDSYAKAFPIDRAESKATQRPSELEYRVPDKV